MLLGSFNSWVGRSPEPKYSTQRKTVRVKIKVMLAYSVIRGMKTFREVMPCLEQRYQKRAASMQKPEITHSCSTNPTLIIVLPVCILLSGAPGWVRYETPMPLKASKNREITPRVTRTWPGCRGVRYGT